MDQPDQGEIPMLCCRIAAGGLAILAASVVNASAQSCLLPRGCQDSPSSVEKVEPKATDANATRNVKNNSSSQKGSLRIVRLDPRRLSAAESHQRLPIKRLGQQDKMLGQEKEAPLFKKIRQAHRQENQSSTPTDQAARDVLFDEFLRWQVRQVIVEPESPR